MQRARKDYHVKQWAFQNGYCPTKMFGKDLEMTDIRRLVFSRLNNHLLNSFISFMTF